MQQFEAEARAMLSAPREESTTERSSTFSGPFQEMEVFPFSE